MKKLMLLLALLMALGSAQAETVTFDIGKTSLVLPLQTVNVIQLYSWDEQLGFTGAETLLVKHGDLELTLGAATGYSNGVQFPFVGVQVPLPKSYFEDVNNAGLKFGVWYGRDFDERDDKWGIKGSIPLWQ